MSNFIENTDISVENSSIEEEIKNIIKGENISQTDSEELPGMSSALFIGCHADDLEIGAGGTIAKMINSGWDVWCCILTREADDELTACRRAEQLAASNILGVDKKKIFFLDFSDGNLQCSREAVGEFRRVLEEKNCHPDLVFTHTNADSHNDHRAAHDLTRSTFRKKPILSYAVVNSHMASEFRPKIFVDISKYNELKHNACDVYSSQGKRIMHTEMYNLNKNFGTPLGHDYAEGFELLIQEGAEDMMYLALSINDDAFHNFWYPLINTQTLNIIRSTPVHRAKQKFFWPAYKELDGINLLLKSFTELWHDRNPVELQAAGDPVSENILLNSSALISGSGVANVLTRNYFDHFKGIRYFVDYTMPDYQNLHIVDRQTKKKIFATYKDDGLGNPKLIKDVGILTIMRNPMRETKHIIGCMGIHGFGTLACFKVISDPVYLQELAKYVETPIRGNGVQLLIDYDPSSGTPAIRHKSVYHF